MSKTLIEKAIELTNWKSTVADMGTIALKENYEYSNPKNKYYRFTDHIKCWIQGLLGVREEDGSFLLLKEEDMTKEEKSWEIVRRNTRELNTNWWKVALNGKGKTDKPLPIMNFTTSEEDASLVKDQIYATLLPAYRALKESFDKRSVFQWIFNHRQYTAERDSLKVIKNIMLSLTGDSVETFNEKYEAYKVELPTSNITEMHRIEKTRERMTAAALAGQEELRREQALEDLKVIREEQKKEEMEEIMNKAADELTMKDQFSICAEDGNFKTKVTDDLKAAFAGKGNPALLKLMATSHVYNPLIGEVEKFCKEFDLAVENGLNKADLAKVVNDGVKNVFSVALNATKNLKVADVKDRIIVAQKLTDVILNAASPVAFKQNEYGAYGKGFVVLQNADAIRDMLGSEVAPDAIDTAINGAQETFGTLYPENKAQNIEQIQVNLNEPKTAVVPPVESNALDSNVRNLDK